MTRVAPLLTLILTSSLLTWTAAQASILCSWKKVLPNKEVHYSFLRRSQGSPSLRLYHGSWSPGQRTLLGCAWSDDAAVIQNYFSLCQERTDGFSEQPDEDFDVRSVFEAEGLCVPAPAPEVGDGPERAGKRPVRSVEGHTAAGSTQNRQDRAGRSEVRTHQRVKRGFIVPGTLWCGSGNKAPSYEDLGVFTDTDSCCREHDQCKHTILSFQSQFGVFNSNIFTMSHCDCDRKFHTCLMEARDSISDVVGYTFFNLLKMHCFVFAHRLQCTQRNWFGMCKETKLALYAEVHPPTPFVDPSDASLNSSVVNTTLPSGLLENTRSHPQLFSITAAASTSSPSASSNPATNYNISTATNTPQGPPGSERKDDLENTLTTGKQTQSQPDITEKQLSCAVYKDLDDCRDKILPQQRRYGLQNQEATTLYHCNCTYRLFQTLAEQKRLSEVQTLLMGRVSQSCFLPQGCRTGESCPAVLLEAELPQLDPSGGAHVEEQRHLQAVRSKVRRPSGRRGRAERLHKLCLRKVRPKHSKTTNSVNTSPQ